VDKSVSNPHQMNFTGLKQGRSPECLDLEQIGHKL